LDAGDRRTASVLIRIRVKSSAGGRRKKARGPLGSVYGKKRNLAGRHWVKWSGVAGPWPSAGPGGEAGGEGRRKQAGPGREKEKKAGKKKFRPRERKRIFL
jgi:hypothetical protein